MATGAAARPKMSEKQLEKGIIALARQLGYRVHGVRPSPANREAGRAKRVMDNLKGDKGYPDLTIVGRGRMFFWELKVHGAHTKAGTPSPDQLKWGEEIQAAGLNYAVIRPAQWWSGEVEAALMGREVDLPVR